MWKMNMLKKLGHLEEKMCLIENIVTRTQRNIIIGMQNIIVLVM